MGEDEATPEVERLWPSRLRWRMRGAWQWPTFFALTIIDGVLLVVLPPYGSGPGSVPAGILLAGFANLLLVAVVAPLVGRRLLRARRPDLPRLIADDYAGTAAMWTLFVVLLLAGVAHRPFVASEDRDHHVVFDGLHDYVRAHAPEYTGALGRADARRLEKHYYRACVPSLEPRRALCVFVDARVSPARVRVDTDRTPNVGQQFP
jgi:hypothetical protein